MSGLVETFVASPVGELRLVASNDALVGVFFVDHTPAPSLVARRVDDHRVLRLATGQLAEYFAGSRRSFTVPIALDGTPHQCAVWRGLASIPFGTTTSYGELARTLPHRTAARALGHANARNPLSIVLPCHRVVGSSGALTGYAGGLERKAWLLDHEAKMVAGARRGNLRTSAGV